MKHTTRVRIELEIDYIEYVSLCETAGLFREISNLFLRDDSNIHDFEELFNKRFAANLDWVEGLKDKVEKDLRYLGGVR